MLVVARVNDSERKRGPGKRHIPTALRLAGSDSGFVGHGGSCLEQYIRRLLGACSEVGSCPAAAAAASGSADMRDLVRAARSDC